MADFHTVTIEREIPLGRLVSHFLQVDTIEVRARLTASDLELDSAIVVEHRKLRLDKTHADEISVEKVGYPTALTFGELDEVKGKLRIAEVHHAS